MLYTQKTIASKIERVAVKDCEIVFIDFICFDNRIQGESLPTKDRLEMFLECYFEMHRVFNNLTSEINFPKSTNELMVEANAVMDLTSFLASSFVRRVCGWSVGKR